MRILMVHNYYQRPGGEDIVFQAETELLRRKGHEVITFTDHNDNVDGQSRLRLARDTIWSDVSYHELQQIIDEHKPDVAHFHNTFVRISPSGYYACQRKGLPVVQSLHNSRLMCPAAGLTRNGCPCELCISRTFAWPGIQHACYRQSRAQTAVVVTMLAYHKIRRTWYEQVNRYITFTQFHKDKFIQGGFDPDKITIKPHFVDSPPAPLARFDQLGNYALYVGRLDTVKGIQTVIQAWEHLPQIPLYVVGEGPLQSLLSEFVTTHPNHSIKILGQLPHAAVRELMLNARLLVWPSEGYFETFGLVAVEAFSCGTPVIASRTGIMRDIVQDNVTGLHFSPGDSVDLAERIRLLWDNPELCRHLGQNARQTFIDQYTADKNYEMLIAIYRSVM